MRQTPVGHFASLGEDHLGDVTLAGQVDWQSTTESANVKGTGHADLRVRLQGV